MGETTMWSGTGEHEVSGEITRDSVRGDGEIVAREAREDAARLFRALNRLVHEPSADARRQADEAIRRHKAIDPAWWDDVTTGGPAVVASTTASYTITRR